MSSLGGQWLSAWLRLLCRDGAWQTLPSASTLPCQNGHVWLISNLEMLCAGLEANSQQQQQQQSERQQQQHIEQHATVAAHAEERLTLHQHVQRRPGAAADAWSAAFQKLQLLSSAWRSMRGCADTRHQVLCRQADVLESHLAECAAQLDHARQLLHDAQEALRKQGSQNQHDADAFAAHLNSQAEEVSIRIP
eukprot:364904-Chlamydomonas_euryale.AAC.10